MKVGIVVGTIRDGGAGTSVGDWVLETAQKHGGADFELIPVADFDVPLLTSSTVPMAADKQYDSDEVTRWSQAVDACDAFIFVTAEYNHSVPGAFKNAVDSLGSEWVGKTAGLVSYGADAGVRAVEHWRQILANFSMHVVRDQVSIRLFSEFGDDGFTPSERREGQLTALIDTVLATAALFARSS